MDHPLTADKQIQLRKRVVQLLKRAYKAHRSSNIVFVCGGTEATDMRLLFQSYCADNLPDYEIFLPEYAIDNVFSTEDNDQFDISDFEVLISELSHAIVIFPEAAGSFSETGYFSAINLIAKRCIPVLDIKYQKEDSFLSLGPVKKILEKSIFHPLIQIDYTKPDFRPILERIRKRNQSVYKKSIQIGKFGDLNTYDTSCLIHQVVHIMTIATIDDILYTFKVLFKNSYSEPKIRKLLSVLVGSKYLLQIGEFGYVSINPTKPHLLELREGFAEEEREIRLLLAGLYQESDPDFLNILESS